MSKNLDFAQHRGEHWEVHQREQRHLMHKAGGEQEVPEPRTQYSGRSSCRGCGVRHALTARPCSFQQELLESLAVLHFFSARCARRPASAVPFAGPGSGFTPPCFGVSGDCVQELPMQNRQWVPILMALPEDSLDERTVCWVASLSLCRPLLRCKLAITPSL